MTRGGEEFSVLRVRHLACGQLERVNPNAMHGTLVVLTGSLPI